MSSGPLYSEFINIHARLALTCPLPESIWQARYFKTLAYKVRTPATDCESIIQPCPDLLVQDMIEHNSGLFVVRVEVGVGW